MSPDTLDKLEGHLKLVNQLLPGASPIGAYCLGMLTSNAIGTGIWPSEKVLISALACKTVHEGARIVGMLRAMSQKPMEAQ